MNTENKILGNQLVVLSRSDLDTMVNEMAQNIVAAQTKNMLNDSEAGMDAPEGMRFITRKETASLLHVNYTTLWRWNNNAPSADSLLFYNSVGQMWGKMTKQKSQVLHFQILAIYLSDHYRPFSPTVYYRNFHNNKLFISHLQYI